MRCPRGLNNFGCCGWGEATEEPHTCPYEYDLANGDEEGLELCNCCEDCQKDCAMEL